jgi:hypothetical protein
VISDIWPNLGSRTEAAGVEAYVTTKHGTLDSDLRHSIFLVSFAVQYVFARILSECCRVDEYFSRREACIDLVIRLEFSDSKNRSRRRNDIVSRATPGIYLSSSRPIKW